MLQGAVGCLVLRALCVDRAVVILRAAFDKLWGHLGTDQEAVTATAKPMPTPDAGPSSAERSRKDNSDEDPAIIRKKTRNARRRSNSLIQCDLFVAQMVAAKAALQFLIRILHAGQKDTKLHNKSKKEYADKGKTFMGGTPLSNIICGGRAESYRESFFDLLGDDSLEDHSSWGGMWDYVPPHLEGKAFALVATLGLTLVCSYEFRITKYFDSLHVQVLHLVEHPPDEFDSARKGVAVRLLAATKDTLITKEGDFPWKLVCSCRC